jgi:two-component system phosphate regulon sensor histidine kinase PhoR
MKQGRLLWRIYLYFLVAALAALAIATGNAVRTMRRFHEDTLTHKLDILCRGAARDVARLSPALEPRQVDRLCKELGERAGARITVVLPGGKVIGDSDQDPAVMDNHSGRPEIGEAFLGNTATSVRYSDTLKQRMKYLAVPVERDGAIVAAARIAQPLAQIRWTQAVISRQLLVGGLLAVVFFGLVALYLSRRTTRPLEQMRRIAGRLAEGDLSARVPMTTDDEIGALADTLNTMAEQLTLRMETIVRQQVEQRAVLACMVEGVLAVSAQTHVLYLNDAGARLLNIADPEHAKGRLLEAIVRHHDVQEFVAATLTNEGASETDLLLRGDPERHLQLHGTPLMDPDGRRIGGLVVMNDITRMKRLERVRSDFVANVSHELKTPITALKGCVETLSSDRPLDTGDAQKFTTMMSRHVSRLESIVNDLLCLSRIEAEEQREDVPRDRTNLADVLRRVAQTFTGQARARHIALNVDCPDDISATINAALIEQAIGNLVDNAVKYGTENTSVTLAARREADTIAIRVADQGPGINKQHLSRIFERFYRVDKARSRALGGTGLGLAIVRHIALAHNGNVSVESSVGEGTTFTLRLPCSHEPSAA